MVNFVQLTSLFYLEFRATPVLVKTKSKHLGSEWSDLKAGGGYLAEATHSNYAARNLH